MVGGAGPRTLRIAARMADGCNVRTADLAAALPVLRAELGPARPARPTRCAVSVLDVPVIGVDRDDVAARVERLRGRTPAATFAARHFAGTVAHQVGRYRLLAEAGVRTVFLALPDLSGPDDVARCAPIVAGVPPVMDGPWHPAIITVLGDSARWPGSTRPRGTDTGQARSPLDAGPRPTVTAPWTPRTC